MVTIIFQSAMSNIFCCQVVNRESNILKILVPYHVRISCHMLRFVTSQRRQS